MDIFQPAIANKVVFSLGIINLVTAGLIFSTCRCVPGLKITRKLTRYRAYQRLLRYHCYLWWPFWTSVAVHLIFGIAAIGWPF